MPPIHSIEQFGPPKPERENYDPAVQFSEIYQRIGVHLRGADQREGQYDAGNQRFVHTIGNLDDGRRYATISRFGAMYSPDVMYLRVAEDGGHELCVDIDSPPLDPTQDYDPQQLGIDIIDTMIITS